MDTVKDIGRSIDGVLSNHLLIVSAVGVGAAVLFFTPIGTIVRAVLSDITNPVGAIQDALTSIKNVPAAWSTFGTELSQGKFKTTSFLSVMPAYQIGKSLFKF